MGSRIGILKHRRNRAQGGNPHVKRVEIRVMPDDEGADLPFSDSQSPEMRRVGLGSGDQGLPLPSKGSRFRVPMHDGVPVRVLSGLRNPAAPKCGFSRHNLLEYTTLWHTNAQSARKAPAR